MGVFLITIRYKDLGAAGFQHTIHKLRQTPMRSPAAFGIKGLIKQIEQGLLKFQEQAKELFQEYAVTGKAPEPNEPAPTGKSFELKLPCQVKDGKEEEAKKAFDAFGERPLELKGRKLSPELLFESNSWSPRELEALEPILEEPPLE